MSEFDNTNRGSIWKNDKKEKPSHPDFTGSLNVDGREYWVSAWKRKEGAAAKAPALSFSIKPKEDQPRTSRQAPQRSISERAMPRGPANRNADMDDEIPF